MGLEVGTYNLTANSGNIFVFTFKEGLLSTVAHDLLIRVTDFTVRVDVPTVDFTTASVEAEISANSLKVVCAMKDGQQQPETLKEKDIAEIEEAIVKDVLHPSRYPDIRFRSTQIQEKNGCYAVKGELNLHGVTRPVEFNIELVPGRGLKGDISLFQKDFGIKPYKALLGTLKVKNEVVVAFDLFLN